MKAKLAREDDYEWMAPIQKSAKMPIWKPNATSWVIGKAAFAIWQKIGNECELLSLAVKKTLRRKGYARQIMAYSQDELAKMGIDSFYLEVRESNEAAISLYKSLGYEKISERKGYYPGGESAIAMKR